MAITGAHVQCGFVADFAGAKLFSPVWSETIALGQSTTQTAPSGNMIFRVRAPSSGEMFSVAGLSPDASVVVAATPDKARSHHLASEEKDLPAQSGWKCNVVSG